MKFRTRYQRFIIAAAATAVGLLQFGAFASHLPAQNRPAWQEEAREFGWLLDYEQAREVARESGKPLMVHFRCIP